MNITPVGIWGAFPNKNEATSSFLLEQDGFRCLFDCGSGVVSAVQNYTELREIDAIAISHYHADHIADIGVFQHAAMIGMQLKEWETLVPIYAHNRDKEAFGKLTFKGVTEGRALNVDQPVQIGPWEVSFCETIHPVYCLAMKFSANGKSVVFTADTSWQEKLIEFSQEVDLLVAESNLYEKYIGIIEGHMSGSQAGTLAARANAGKLLLTHLPQYGNLEEILQAAKETYKGDVAFAEIGKTYSI
ncbi:MBL fold metallo-hydrolase [Planococcus sp. YIM B11945]|uniref:MBL fold metallo-hydrolase n=1 Tax=Planococcus sp. YIM B11945 TaxID=3435410 RepID=UPI003D7ECEA9